MMKTSSPSMILMLIEKTVINKKNKSHQNKFKDMVILYFYFKNIILEEWVQEGTTNSKPE